MKIKELMPLMKTHGRLVYDEEKEALFCNWTASGFSIGFKGKEVKVKVIAFSDKIPGMRNMPEPDPDWPCIGAVLDDGEELIVREEINVDEKTVTLFTSETEEDHVLRFIKLSENARGKLGVVELETDGEFYKVEINKPTMEIVGDSITCGFGNEAPNNSFQFKTSEENGWMSYGAQAARKLGYEFSMICESGIQAVKPENPMWAMHAMEDIYEYTDELHDKKFGRECGKWDFEKNHSDIVVLNLGTNDSNPIRFYQDFNQIESMEKWFHVRFKEFVKQIRRANGPDTWIMCSLGSMDYYLYYHIKEVVDELKEETGDEKLCCFEYIPINVMFEGYGGAGHPSAKTHKRMGEELARYIAKFTGAKYE